MDLTKQERLIIANQLKILEKLYPEEADYYSVQRKAIENGYNLHYADLVENLYDEMSEDECREVVDILDMYRALTFSFEKIKDSKTIKDDDVHFYGFDGNNETSQYLYTKYFILDLERFDELKYGKEHPDFNSHWPKLDKYRQMLNIWNTYDEKYELTETQIEKILGK